MNRLKIKEHLLPCPFCGGEADCSTAHHPAGYQVKFVQCKRCGNRTDDFPINEPNQAMISRWNARTASDK